MDCKWAHQEPDYAGNLNDSGLWTPSPFEEYPRKLEITILDRFKSSETSCAPASLMFLKMLHSSERKKSYLFFNLPVSKYFLLIHTSAHVINYYPWYWSVLTVVWLWVILHRIRNSQPCFQWLERDAIRRIVVLVTDASFIRVFSQMKLREFRFESEDPLQNVRYRKSYFWLENFISFSTFHYAPLFIVALVNAYANFFYFR